MAEAPEPHGTPRRPFKEFEDNHFHDDDEVAQPPAEEAPRTAGRDAPSPRPPRKLPPRPRRFHED
jgi:hypothetical protein